MKESKLFREFSGKETRHKKSIQDKRKHQGAGCKTVGVIPFLCPRAYRGAAALEGWRHRRPRVPGARVSGENGE
jgi:hypothetical protein